MPSISHSLCLVNYKIQTCSDILEIFLHSFIQEYRLNLNFSFDENTSQYTFDVNTNSMFTEPG